MVKSLPKPPSLKAPSLPSLPSIGRIGQVAREYVVGTARGRYENIPVGEPFIICESLVKIYKIADLEVFALQGLDLIVRRGEMMAIIGNSGSGKSTLLNILGGLDTPSAGRALVGGRDLGKLTGADQVRYKREVVGFVWQNTGRNLVPYLTALENVELPLALAGNVSPANRAWARELLEMVNLGDRMHHKLNQLSGGQQQRVAIAIGLINRPPLLLADEPTGSVDTTNAGVILDIFRKINATYHTTIVIVTHDQSLARQVERFVAIRDGKTSAEVVRRVAQLDAEEQAAEGDTATHDEYVVLDSAGRLQVPRDYLDRLGVKDRRVLLEFDGDHIKIVPPKEQ
ncbi:MAG: ABC transporter ATP-binding protein [Chloroflexi bacterium]|nr:ABC transporter ATP-binding protein [Chloroflexota bacterium]